LAEDVSDNDANGRSTFSVSRNGVLVYRNGSQWLGRQISWRDRTGKVLSVVGQPGTYRTISLSPDEKTVAILEGMSSGVDLSLMDVASGVRTPLTRQGALALTHFPSRSPDSKRIAVSRQGGGIAEIEASSGKMRILTKDDCASSDWTPDGRSVLCVAPQTRVSLLLLEEGLQMQTLLTAPYAVTQFRISPDGKLVAYSSSESESNGIYVASFPGFGLKRKVSTADGSYPAWSRTGKELYYRASGGMLMEVDVHGAAIEASTPKPLFRFGTGSRGNRFAVTSDGRFLMNEPLRGGEPEGPKLTVMLNWAAEMKQQ